MNKNKLLITMCLILCTTMSVLPVQAGIKRYVPSVEDWVATYVNASQGVTLTGLKIGVVPTIMSVIVLASYDPAIFTQAQVEAIAQEVFDFTHDYVTSRKIKDFGIGIDVAPLGN